MKKIKTLLSIAIMVAFLFSCSEDTVEPESDLNEQEQEIDSAGGLDGDPSTYY